MSGYREPQQHGAGRCKKTASKIVTRKAHHPVPPIDLCSRTIAFDRARGSFGMVTAAKAMRQSKVEAEAKREDFHRQIFAKRNVPHLAHAAQRHCGGCGGQKISGH